VTLTYQCTKPRGFLLTSPWLFAIAEGRFEVPQGFLCDLASIPRPLTVVPGFAKYELGTHGPICHDWSYQHGGAVNGICLTRKRTDDLFYTLMRGDGVGAIRGRIAWTMVRLFGWLAWRRMPDRDRALWMAQ
jgi:hypothetical protein